jgi:hypothetical protein
MQLSIKDKKKLLQEFTAGDKRFWRITNQQLVNVGAGSLYYVMFTSILPSSLFRDVINEAARDRAFYSINTEAQSGKQITTKEAIKIGLSNIVKVSDVHTKQWFYVYNVALLLGEK